MICNSGWMFRPSTHAHYLRTKAERFRELAEALHSSTSAELLKLAEEMESNATGLESGLARPAGTPAQHSRKVSEPLDERRLIFRVLRHWTEMAIAQRFPRKENIDPWLLGDDWTNCLLLKIGPDVEDSTFYAVGTNLLPPGQSLDGASISHRPDGTVLADLLTMLRRCISTAAPIIVERTTTNFGMPIMYRGILMPLSEDGQTVDTIFGAANFKKITSASQQP